MKRPYQILWPLLSLFLVRVDLTDLWPLDLPVQILNVYDGDTVLVRYGRNELKVRFAKIDAPELGQTFINEKGDAGDLSRRCLRRILNKKKSWILRPEKNDIYGRILGDLEEVSLELIVRGCASLYPHAQFSSRQEKHFYLKALKRAKYHRVGIWHSSGIRQPKLWRKTKKQTSRRR